MLWPPGEMFARGERCRVWLNHHIGLSVLFGRAQTQAFFAAFGTELTPNSALVDPEQICAVKSQKAGWRLSRWSDRFSVVASDRIVVANETCSGRLAVVRQKSGCWSWTLADQSLERMASRACWAGNLTVKSFELISPSRNARDFSVPTFFRTASNSPLMP